MGRLAALLVAAGGVGCLTAGLAAQEPGAGVTVVGVVRDGETDGPVAGATIAVEGTPARTFADSAGSFALAGVPPGPQLLRVEAFGYADLLVPLDGTEAPRALELVLEPRPLEVEGFDVRTGGRVTVRGVLLDAVSGAGLPWASLWLRDERRSGTEGDGSFRIPRVAPGSYLLLAERLGYRSRYFQVRVGGASEPLVLRLEPDPMLLEGITVATRRFQTRRRAFASGPVREYDEDRLGLSGAPDVRSFLEHHAFLPLVPCRGRGGGTWCVEARRRAVQPTVYIDEVPVFCGLDVLASYDTRELYLLEVYDGGRQIRAYTRAFMERLARRPRTLIPADIPTLVRC